MQLALRPPAATFALLRASLFTLAKYDGMREGSDALRKAGIGKALGVHEDPGDITLPSLKKDAQEDSVKNLSHFAKSTRLIHSA